MQEVRGLDRRALDRARISRDPRFDGRFFIAVTSTGIYCRPICPSPTSKSANVLYFPTAAAAAEAGFRPCLRCRPEAAPGTPAWLGTSAVVRRALRLIHEGALDDASVEDLASRVGVGSRHLHRLFVRHVGASPIAVAQTRRLHFAKRLLDETHLSMTEIALAAGFGSLRRFNDAFHDTYGKSPRELRRQRGGGTPSVGRDEVVLKLARILRTVERNEEALELFKRYQSMVPGDYQVLAHIGSCLSAMGRLDEAESYFRQALKGLDDPVTHFNMALLLALTNRLDDAVAEYEKALERDPMHSDARTNLAAALARQGKLDRAARELKILLGYDPENAGARTNFGLVLLRQGRFADARGQLEEALRLDPGLTPAREALASIPNQ